MAVAGPAERALSDLVHEANGLRLDVERAAPGAPAEFRADALGEDPRHLAKTLADLDGIDAALAVPPRVYLTPSDGVLLDAVTRAVASAGPRYGWQPPRNVPMTFSIGCPNANKPLHVGHLRNVFLGKAAARLHETQGYDVVTTEELSNFGLHIAQALIAYERWGGGSPDMKADHWVGSFYTRFHAERLAVAAYDDEVTELDVAASDLLRRQWAGDPDAVAVNERVTEWAIAGIRETYERVGMRHDFVLRELEALPAAMALLEPALADGTLRRRPDGSVYIDLSDVDLGEVTLLRKDGTPLSLVFFVAIWVRRAQLHPHGRVVRITGEQWRESFTQFLEIMRRLGVPEIAGATDGIWYGMIRSPDGKIRSRTGNEVSADALLDHFRDRFVEDWGDVSPYRFETCERLAVALMKTFILAKRREDTITYDNDAVWAETARLARIAAVLRHVPGDVRPAEGKAARRAVRDLALHVNALPWVFTRAASRYDASDVLAHADRIARTALDAMRRGVLDSALHAAAARALRNALDAVDVALPSSLRELPPSLLDR